MDTTYFWRERWVTIFRRRHIDPKKRKNLYRCFVKNETNQVYRDGIKFLENKWRKVIWIVCDWRQWLLWWFGDIPTQFCIYHFKQVIRRYLTRNPKLQQNIDLKAIADDIWKWKYDSMMWLLSSWHTDNKKRLAEKNDNGWYMHERARKAYRSLKKKMYRAYTYEREWALLLPKTNNSLESINSHLKTKIRIHRWMKRERKQKFIRYYLYIS